MENRYMVVSFIVLELFGFIFIKFWGRKVIPTFISGVTFILTISSYRPLIDEPNLLNIILPIISTGSLILLIYMSLNQLTDAKSVQPNLNDAEEQKINSGFSIFKEKTIYISIGCCLVLGVIAFFINKKNTPYLKLKDAYNLFLTMLLLPLLYELFIHEIVWKLIDKKKNIVLKIILYTLTTGLLIWLSCADWAYTPVMFISSAVTLIGAGLFRIFRKNNSDFWVCILLRGIFYFMMFSFAR